jgi:excisionase family DNA binding protein
MQDEPFLTVAAAAQRLAISQESVRIWLRTGKLRGYRPGGDKIGWRIPASEVERVLRSEPAAKTAD